MNTRDIFHCKKNTTKKLNVQYDHTKSSITLRDIYFLSINFCVFNHRNVSMVPSGVGTTTARMHSTRASWESCMHFTCLGAKWAA